MGDRSTEKGSLWAVRSLAHWRLIAAVSATAMLLMLAWAPTKELLQPWRRAQSEYNRLAPSYGLASVPAEVRQVWIPDAARADRCVSCHLGMLDLPALDSHPPYQPHPQVAHSPETHGCTYCHSGQGWATVAADAHGEEGSWPHPIYVRRHTEAGCGVCHSGVSVPLPEEVEGVEETIDRYGCRRCHVDESEDAPPLVGIALRGVPEGWVSRHVGLTMPDDETRPVTQAGVDEVRQLEAWLRTRIGAPVLARGKMVFQQLGCLGCHRRGEVGGDVGPDLTTIGERDVREIAGDTAGPATLPDWLRQHLVEPQQLLTESRMPPVDLEELEVESDLEDLVTYLLSLRGDSPPTSLTPRDRARSDYRLGRDFPTSGRGLYVTFCSACHGFYATGSELETYGLVTPMIASRGSLATVTPRYLRASILRGRRNRYMPSWAEQDGGLTSAETSSIVDYLMSRATKAEPVATLPRSYDRGRGKAVFEERCLPCHGPGTGEPRLGADLLAPGALEPFDRSTLYDAITVGWVEEGMPSFAFLRSQDAADLLAFLGRPDGLGSARAVGHDGQHSHLGLQIWAAKCAECHGTNGEGGSGPLLNTTHYLDWANDDYLSARIGDHREDRARSTIGGISDDDLEALLDHLRSWAGWADPAVEMEPDPAAVARGRALFGPRCSECHGAIGEGSTGPALASRDFLDLVSRPFLVMSTLEGRKGTPMQAWKVNDELPVSLQDAYDLADYILSFRSSEGAGSTMLPGSGPEDNRKEVG